MLISCKGIEVIERCLYNARHAVSRCILARGHVGKCVSDAEDTIDRLHEALKLIAAGAVCPDLFPAETNGDALAAKTAMTIAMAALDVSTRLAKAAEHE